MIFKKIKKLLIKIGIATMLVFAAINPVLGHTNNNRILLDLAHSDTMYYSNGTLIRDEGASYQGYSEREITNQITLKVKEKLETAGLSVDLTRDFDDSVTLEERIEKANKFGYACYISLHANISEGETNGGTESYSNNLWSLSNDICKDISQKFNIPYRGTKTTPYYNRLIDNSSIIELGFMNSKTDLDMMLNNQEELATIIADNIISKYCNQETKEITTQTGEKFNILINYK